MAAVQLLSPGPLVIVSVTHGAQPHLSTNASTDLHLTFTESPTDAGTFHCDLSAAPLATATPLRLTVRGPAGDGAPFFWGADMLPKASVAFAFVGAHPRCFNPRDSVSSFWLLPDHSADSNIVPDSVSARLLFQVGAPPAPGDRQV